MLAGMMIRGVTLLKKYVVKSSSSEKVAAIEGSVF